MTTKSNNLTNGSEKFRENIVKDVLYSMFGPDLVGLTVAVWNIVG